MHLCNDFSFYNGEIVFFFSNPLSKNGLLRGINLGFRRVRPYALLMPSLDRWSKITDLYGNPMYFFFAATRQIYRQMYMENKTN